jgi:DUF4097 and DUF4098 domain-containing protein YvlB
MLRQILWLSLVALVPLYADVEDRSTETRVFPVANLVIVDNVNGSIEVTGHAGAEVQIEVVKRIQAETPERLDAAKREVKLDMVQSGDTVKLFVDGPFRCPCVDRSTRSFHQGYHVTYDFKLRVPQRARVDLYTVNRGQIVVRGMAGEFDVRNVNGGVEMVEIGGSGRAHTVNGPVKVAFSRNPTAPTSFETVNGNVDVTFRKGLAADIRVDTMHGGVYTDFEVSALPVEASSERRNGKIIYRHRTGVRVGGGGTELRMKTLNGDIFIRDLEAQRK